MTERNVDARVWEPGDVAMTARGPLIGSRLAVAAGAAVAAGVRPRDVRSLLSEGDDVAIERLAAAAAATGGGAETSGRGWTEPITVWCSTDPDWPTYLADVPAPPPVLFLRGDAQTLTRPGVAVVGSRTMSRFGSTVAELAASTTATLAGGTPVVSGGADGVDTTAHRVALDAGAATTVVVAGHLAGDRRRHVLEAAASPGSVVVSEVAPDRQPTPQALIARNRVIVGLSSTVVVAEAALRSGTMHAVRFALAANRSLLVARPRPGFESSPTAAGPLALADPAGMDPDVCRFTGQDAERLRARRPVADGVASSRDELAQLITVSHLFFLPRRR